MTDFTIEVFYHDLRQNTLAGSEARLDYLESEFLLSLANELEDAGVIEGFEPCHYKAQRGMRVDGYWFKEEESAIDLFILDFENRESIESLTKTDVISIFRRLEKFFMNSVDEKMYRDLEETSPGYGLSRDIVDRKNKYSKVNLYLVSERNLSERIQAMEDVTYRDWTFSYHVWDVSRFYRQQISRGAKEDLIVDFVALCGNGLPCLPAHLSTADYESYLLVMPAEILAELYGKYGARLLEQNVRCFLQARGNVNKGIRATIMNDPEMFFAYNNGITATAKEVITEQTDKGIFIKSIRDLQIVNGGQTTASLFQTNKKDNAPIDHVFLQMKLSVVDEEK
ncbi:MAG: AIPR family protein, partial [Odoribacter sp.]|nr:AIPR family protein [Odoribacter sp.]